MLVKGASGDFTDIFQIDFNRTRLSYQFTEATVVNLDKYMNEIN